MIALFFSPNSQLNQTRRNRRCRVPSALVNCTLGPATGPQMNLPLPDTCLAVFVDETGDELLRDPFQKVFGLAGCGVMAPSLDMVVRDPWKDVRNAVTGSPDAHLHATDIRCPTPDQLEAIDGFFRSQPFSRFGAICSVQTTLYEDIGPLSAVARALGNRLADIARWQPFGSVVIFFEHSERLAPQIEQVFGGFNLIEDGKTIPLKLYWMDKSVGEPGLEVADFLANSIGTEVRHRIAKRPGHAKNFEAFFHYPDKRLVSFIDISEVIADAPER